MISQEQVIAQAEQLAANLQQGMHWVPPDAGYGGYWQADRSDLWSVVRGRAVAALAFLEEWAGADSQWVIRAKEVFDSLGDHQSMESGARSVGDLLSEWAQQLESGTVRLRREALLGLLTASTDLMQQVRTLNEDRQVHPAAPILLAGAAVEIALRGAVEDLGLSLTERPSISSYARCLRSNGTLNAGDIKDVDAIGGVRNDAAHGHFEDLSRERAGLMEQQVNIFLSRLQSRLEEAK
jgi:hypothetical protein